MEENKSRDLNITIKNPEDEEKEVFVSISTILKKLRKYVLVWIVAAVVLFVAAFGGAAVTAQIRQASLSALVSFSYSGIEKGLDPNGAKFDVNSIKNPSVIEAAINELGLDMEQLEYIRQGISIKGIIPRDAVDRITAYQSVYENIKSLNAAQAMLDVSYYPTQYKIYFDYNETGLTSSQALEVFNTILECYQDYFYKTYGYNESLGNSLTAINYQDYDYSESIDVFQESIDSLKTYVKQLANEDNIRFRSSITGYTFDDLYESLNTLESIDLDKISSFVTVNNLTKNKDEALAYYEYRIKNLTRRKAQLEEQLASINESIGSYKNQDVYILGINDTLGAEAGSASTSVNSKQYDSMFQQKLNTTSQLATVKQRINMYKERLEQLKSKPTGSDEFNQRVEDHLASVNDKITKLVDDIANTSKDYYENVTFKNAYSVLVPATNTAADRTSYIIDKAKMPVVVLEALAFVGFFGLAFIEAVVSDSRKRKFAGEYVEDNEPIKPFKKKDEEKEKSSNKKNKK